MQKSKNPHTVVCGFLGLGFILIFNIFCKHNMLLFSLSDKDCFLNKIVKSAKNFYCKVNAFEITATLSSKENNGPTSTVTGELSCKT